MGALRGAAALEKVAAQLQALGIPDVQATINFAQAEADEIRTLALKRLAGGEADDDE